MALAGMAQNQEGVRQNEEKWTPILMEAGWTVIPSIILERQRALGLDATDINILLHLVRHWWFSENLPHPSKRTIADCMEISVSTVRRRIAAMEHGRLIKRVARYDPVRGQQTNVYDLSGLIETVTPFAQEAIEVRKKRRDEDAKRHKRKRPLLNVVDSCN